MKLRPTQIVGLVAIVVFGGILGFTLTQPSEKQRMEKVLASLPSPPEMKIEIPPIEIPTAPAMPDFSKPDPEIEKKVAAEQAAEDARVFGLGSQAARDDLYCAGALYAEQFATKGAKQAEVLLHQWMALDAAGTSKLKSEGATEADGIAASLAHEDKAKADYAAKTLRIPVADCVKRAEALPKT